MAILFGLKMTKNLIIHWKANAFHCSFFFENFHNESIFIFRKPYLTMVKDFIIGLVQGALITLLLSSFNLSFFGFTLSLFGSSLAILEMLDQVILFSIANVAFYFLFSSKAIKGHQMQFVLGLIVGVLFL